MNIEWEKIKKNRRVFRLVNDRNMLVEILNYGGIITKILVPDQNGKRENVVLGYKNYRDYEVNPHFLGALIGRVAGRIKNSCFELDGKRYRLEKNDGCHHLHSGSNGFHHVLWEANPFESPGEIGLELSYLSRDGENGYPGNVKVLVIYKLNNDNQLVIEYRATADQKTPIALTNHSYFNLTGNLKEPVHNHVVQMNCSRFAELDHELIPTGKILETQGTLFDFAAGRKLGEGIMAGSGQNKIVGNGYDHYFIFNSNEQGKVTVKDEASGRVLTIRTNQPGMVMYTSNNLDEGLELAEGKSRKYLGVCFETQASPASLHHAGFPTALLNAGESYQKWTAFQFTVESK
ncbi:aldose epimerase family protein [Thermoactinomyces mirandus]|uniref:Aldose 1-epimerase n=1 Tax=Thermoactinomyces mirandus TaxID=2756294 RepID=A0A7W1XUL1_9BACL|nr:aldose epimerase family protein [Thermoactinomyces mirandus]MBA4603582.1 galactose mutarotase [Thermoactinomyces mirandus]